MRRRSQNSETMGAYKVTFHLKSGLLVLCLIVWGETCESYRYAEGGSCFDDRHSANLLPYYPNCFSRFVNAPRHPLYNLYPFDYGYMGDERYIAKLPNLPCQRYRTIPFPEVERTPYPPDQVQTDPNGSDRIAVEPSPSAAPSPPSSKPTATAVSPSKAIEAAPEDTKKKIVVAKPLPVPCGKKCANRIAAPFGKSINDLEAILSLYSGCRPFCDDQPERSYCQTSEEGPLPCRDLTYGKYPCDAFY